MPRLLRRQKMLIPLISGKEFSGWQFLASNFTN